MHIDGYRTLVPWSYTVGFTRQGWPEVVISGFDPETANRVFHEIYRQLSSGQLTIQEAQSWTLAGWMTCVWRRVDHQRVIGGLVYCAASDAWYRTGRPDVVAYQLVTPDERLGRFPWEEGFDPEFRRTQEELWLPPDSAGPGP